jgi:hypothetical protein
LQESEIESLKARILVLTGLLNEAFDLLGVSGVDRKDIWDIDYRAIRGK